ncbi:MAG: hypothetical protein LBJ11_08325 [Oscillospiraceae bacterium]|jgi:hypothetical protein|nr:hypothetical protein [Oscillospiraceae bacterium]
MFDGMFQSETLYENMQGFEKWVFDLAEKLLAWLNLESTLNGIQSFGENVVSFFQGFGRPGAYGIVDFFDFLTDVIKLFV